MSSNNINITPEVQTDGTFMYLVRVNGEEMAFIEGDETKAILAVDSVAAYEQRRIGGDMIKTYREDLNGGVKVVISKQELGRIMNGGIYVDTVVDMVRIPRVNLSRGRLSITTIPVAPPAPRLFE